MFSNRPNKVLNWTDSHSPGSFQIHPNAVQAPCALDTTAITPISTLSPILTSFARVAPTPTLTEDPHWADLQTTFFTITLFLIQQFLPTLKNSLQLQKLTATWILSTSIFFVPVGRWPPSSVQEWLLIFPREPFRNWIEKLENKGVAAYVKHLMKIILNSLNILKKCLVR